MQVQAIKNKTDLSFKMQFKLSEASEKFIEERLGKTIEELKREPLNLRRNNVKRPEKTFDLLSPRNIYLQQGRVYSVKEAQKIIDSFGEPPFSMFKKWIGNIFTKK